MIYTKTITRAAGGSAAAPFQDKLPVTKGLIFQFELYLPPGSSGLLKVMIKDGGYQVWPSEPGEWFFGDNVLVSFPDRYYVASPNHLLDVYSYNEDDHYSHTFQVRIGQATDPAVISSYLPALQTQDFAAVVAELLAQQDQSYAAQRARAVAAAEAAGVLE